MRRLPRIRTPTQAGFVPSQIPSGPLRVPAAAAITAATSSLSSTARSNNNRQPRRYLSTTPIRPSQVQLSQSQPGKVADQELEEYGDFYDAPVAAEIPTQLVYPHEITSVPAPSAITDPAYKPADTADGLEEIGGVAGWWDEPTHWGSDGGASQYVRNVVRPFGPAEKITDPAVLEVLARRAIVEALVVARFAGTKKRAAVDRLFAHAGGFDRLGKIVRAEVVAGPNGAATLKENADWQRVWDVLKSAVKMSKQQQQQQQQEGEKQAEEGEAVTAEVETEAAVSDAGAPASQLTPQVAKSLIGSWDKGWRKAELRDPVVKFFAAKRIQQLTGHRIPDGKLLATVTIDSFLKQLVEPPKPKKLAELIQTKAMFEDLPNVRVFPRRVTPIDKEKMVGRWKIIVKELEKRDLPVIGTNGYEPAVEERWVSGKA